MCHHPSCDIRNFQKYIYKFVLLFLKISFVCVFMCVFMDEYMRAQRECMLVCIYTSYCCVGRSQSTSLEDGPHLLPCLRQTVFVFSAVYAGIAGLRTSGILPF